MKKKMSKSEMKEKNSLSKNAFKGEKILIYVIVLYIFYMIVVNAMKLMGCIDFNSYLMNDIFYVASLYLCLILIYENGSIDKKEKMPLMGVMIGSILSICDWEFYVLLIIFAANIIIPKFLEEKDWKNTLKNPMKVVFYSIITLEVYSIFMIFNEFLYESKVQTNFLFEFLDIICVSIMILFFLCDKEQEEDLCVEKESESMGNGVYLQLIRQCIWYFLIMVVLVIVAVVFYKNMNSGIEGFTFFIGKSIDRGYLLCEEAGKEWVYFVNRPVSGLGTVLQNTTSYELVELGMGESYQRLLLYVGKCLCQILYGIGGVLTVIMVSILFFISRAVIFSNNRRNRMFSR